MSFTKPDQSKKKNIGFNHCWSCGARTKGPKLCKTCEDLGNETDREVRMAFPTVQYGSPRVPRPSR